MFFEKRQGDVNVLVARLQDLKNKFKAAIDDNEPLSSVEKRYIEIKRVEAAIDAYSIPPPLDLSGQ